MVELKILHTKEFMVNLLTGKLFSDYLLENAVIETFNTFDIDGHLHKEFYGEDLENDPSLAKYAMSQWNDIQPIAFNLIKGKHTPLSFRFILHLKPDVATTSLEDENVAQPTADYVVRISFSEGCIKLTTGISIKVFSLDNSASAKWDAYFKKFLSDNQIDFEEE